MAEKLDAYSSYGQKVISLFGKLLFTGERHSLIDLARILNCSKQTVLRLVGDIQRSYGVDIEETMVGRRKYYRLKKVGSVPPTLNLTDTEFSALYMCRTFAEHLLGREILEEATRALEKGRTLLPKETPFSSRHFASFKPGSIDYTPHQDVIRTILDAMTKTRICRLTYKSIMAKRAKTFYIMPLKIFSHHDTIYLHARLARKPGQPYKEPEYDPLLAVHRIERVELDERLFTFPEDYDFERTFNRNFGVIKEDSFEVKMEFSGFAARFVAERIWSPDQEIKDLKNGRIRLSFSASSEPELIAWVLSFGDEARLIKPVWLVKKVKQQVNWMDKNYTQ
jgi:predicted DNA-binding transcriptional regulator YafY